MIESFDGETLLALDGLPETADANTCIGIIHEVHTEGVAAVMAQGDIPRRPDVRGASSGLPTRPRSGPVEDTGVRYARGWS